MSITLDLRVTDTPFAAEHRRLTHHGVRRNEGIPDQKQTLAGEWHPQAVVIARENWRTRMAHEHESAAVFASLLPQFMEANLPIELKTSINRMALDELFHAELCSRVVELLDGEPIAEIEPTLEPLPRHEDATRLEAALRNALFACALSETISMALLTAERERCREPFIAEVLKQLTADEVAHGKIGWTVLAYGLPRLEAAARQRTDKYLLIAFAHIERCMLDAMPLGGAPEAIMRDAEALGVTDGVKARELFYATMEQVIVPRLGELGLNAEYAWKNR
ncbi:MAG: hypothetical protein ACJAYU_002790 [Bradymonadia bacterium]